MRAAMIATKQAYDLVKIAVELFGCRPSTSFHFDSLSVGRQAEGLWQAKKDKIACHLQMAYPMQTCLCALPQWRPTE